VIAGRPKCAPFTATYLLHKKTVSISKTNKPFVMISARASGDLRCL
jgi:hypothetical protein